MHEFFDFLGTPTGSRLLGVVSNVLTIVAAVISGKALQNTAQLKNAIGGVVRKPFKVMVKDLFRRNPRHGRSTSATLTEQPPSLVERLDRVEGLKNTYERAWVLQGIVNSKVEKRLNRVDPPRRRAMNTDD